MVTHTVWALVGWTVTLDYEDCAWKGVKVRNLKHGYEGPTGWGFGVAIGVGGEEWLSGCQIPYRKWLRSLLFLSGHGCVGGFSLSSLLEIPLSCLRAPSNYFALFTLALCSCSLSGVSTGFHIPYSSIFLLDILSGNRASVHVCRWPGIPVHQLHTIASIRVTPPVHSSQLLSASYRYLASESRATHPSEIAARVQNRNAFGVLDQ